jgi:hypothetical protein
MRARTTLLLSLALLFGASLAGATPADTPAVAAPAQAAPACAAASLFQQEALPFTPPLSFKAGVLCGSCSPSPCQGLNINASCYYLTRTGYAIGKCHADFTCTDPGFSAGCICRNGPDV